MSEMECIQKYHMYQKTRVEEKLWIVEIGLLTSIYTRLLRPSLKNYNSVIDLEKLIINEFIFYLTESYPCGEYTFVNVLQEHCTTNQYNRFVESFHRECESLIHFIKQNVKGYSWYCDEIHPGYKIQIKGVKLVYD